MDQQNLIYLTEAPIQPGPIIEQVTSHQCGAIDVFIGTVRDQTQQRAVTRLEFEAYGPMAVKELQKIAEDARAQWPIDRLAVVHRTGVLDLGEIAVIIAVSTPHRAASFTACKYIIDTLKETVPIWKKEVFEDGEVWVAAHP